MKNANLCRSCENFDLGGSCDFDLSVNLQIKDEIIHLLVRAEGSFSLRKKRSRGSTNMWIFGD